MTLRGNFKPTILQLDSIDSTNLEAMRQAKAGAPEGLCVVAREQTSGRGRLNRGWESPKDAGLYLSVILRPQIAMEQWPLITLMAALAVGDALLRSCDLRADIKWPNDICVNDRKLGGILAETGILGFVPYVAAQIALFLVFWPLRRKREPRARLAWTYFLYIFLAYWINNMTLASGYSSDLNLWFILSISVLYKYSITENAASAELFGRAGRP